MSDLAAQLQEALGGAYRVHGELPLGGLGRLFLATDQSGRPVVVQVLPPDIAARLDKQRFVGSVERVSRLRHPGIQPVAGAGAKGDLVWCISPRPSGESVRFRIERDGVLVPDEALQLLYDAADALAYAHARGIGHGALKPDNIYLVRGRAVLAEYGLRWSLAVALEAEGEGEPALDARADVHALAVVGQQVLGGSDAPVSAALSRALSINRSEQFAGPAEFRDSLGSPPSARRLRARRRVLVAAALLGLAVGVAVLRARSSQPLDPDLIAVAPFEVLEPEHELWREGMVTVLSANLDGAGPLRAVSPTQVLRRWSGSADAQSAVALGAATGAGLVLFGRVAQVGGDSVRITATLMDAQRRSNITEVRASDQASRIDRLADVVTVRLLGELSRTRAIGAVRSAGTRRASLGSGSLLAIKTFLLGEQFYRRSEWDSALAHYNRAIELDSTFALALYRAGIVLGWQLSASDTLSTWYLMRAAAHNRGLPARESLLLVAESLSAAVEIGFGSPDYWRNYRRLYATVDAATRRYPRDPEVWYERAEVRYHYPQFSTLRGTRAAFDQAILLDSAFAPAYIHPIELALQVGDRAGALRYLDRYLSLGSGATYADAARLARQLLEPGLAASEEVSSALDTASADLLTAILQWFRGWPDTLHTGVSLVSLILRGRPSSVAPHADSTVFAPVLARALLYFGRAREAYQALGRRRSDLFAALAWAGGVPAESAEARFARSLGEERLFPGGLAALAAPWWAARGDAFSLRELERRAQLSQGVAGSPRERLFLEYLADASRSYQQLLQGDTVAAAKALLALPDTACARCQLYRYSAAQLLEQARLDSLAGLLLAGDPPGFAYPLAPFWMLWRARVAERQGERDKALDAYRYVREAWARSDSQFQPYLREAEQAVDRLGRGRRR